MVSKAGDMQAAATEAFPSAAAALDGIMTFNGMQDENGAARYILTDADGGRVTVRVEASPLPAGSLAQLRPKIFTDNYVIQLLDSADPAAAESLLAAQLRELAAIREGAALAAASRPADLLAPGPDLPSPPQLTIADRRGIDSLNREARDMSDHQLPRSRRAEARARFSGLLDDLGLRSDGEGAGDGPAVRVRRALTAAALTPQALEGVRDLGRPADQLRAPDAVALGRHRLTAAGHGKAPACPPFRRRLAPRWRDLPALVRAAGKARADASRTTLDWLREQQASQPSGRHPRLPVMIGGGAALAGRHDQTLVIDGQQGWHVATFSAIGQNADQLAPMIDTGFGNPYEFALGHQRVPLDALRYWEDRAAVRGPVVNGHATLRPGDDGRMLADITPSDGSAPLTVEVAGTPVVATGFPRERPPGYALPVPTLPAAACVFAKYQPGAWPELADALAGPEPGHALAAWARQARLPGLGDGTLLDPAMQTIEATVAWEDARHEAPGRVMTGDDLSYSRTSPFAARRWLIVGTGGLAYTSAEIILEGNPDAEVVMMGLGAREPLRYTPQYSAVTRGHVAEAGGDGRLVVVKDPSTLLGRVETRHEARAAVFRLLGYEGDAVVACLGRAGILPGALRPMNCWARTLKGQVYGELMYDDSKQYLGYRAHFTADGEAYDAEVIGSASRFLPTEMFDVDSQHRVAGEWLQETPPETGNVPSGYLTTVLQVTTRSLIRSPDEGRDLRPSPARLRPSVA